MQVSEKVRMFIEENYLFDDMKLDESDSLLENGVIDSTAVLDLVSFLENEFSITITDEELLPENMDSINKISNFIKTKLSA